MIEIRHIEHSEYPWQVFSDGRLTAMFTHEKSAKELVESDMKYTHLFREDNEVGGLVWFQP